jgi:hypothetical protein
MQRNKGGTMKRILLASLLTWSLAGSTQDSHKLLRQSIDVKLAPRSLLLTGGDLDSRSGRYMIEFPHPNECTVLGPIKAESRAFALYRAVSRGGFTLKSSDSGLTVWTVEEWDALKKESWYPSLAAAHEKECLIQQKAGDAQ